MLASVKSSFAREFFEVGIAYEGNIYTLSNSIDGSKDFLLVLQIPLMAAPSLSISHEDRTDCVLQFRSVDALLLCAAVIHLGLYRGIQLLVGVVAFLCFFQVFEQVPNAVSLLLLLSLEV